MSKLIYSFIYSCIARVLFLFLLKPSECCMEYKEYETTNYTLYNDNNFVYESINPLQQEVVKARQTVLYRLYIIV